MAAHIAGDETAAYQARTRFFDFHARPGCNHRDLGACLAQQPKLARRCLTAANDEDPTALEVEENRKIVHAKRSFRPGNLAGTH
jgi:hypothetical protein